MTILAQDTFVRANQTGFGTASDGQVWARVRGAMAWAITSDEGTCNSAGGTFNIFQPGAKTSAPVEVLVRVTPADTTSNTGCIGRYVDANDFYYGVLNAGSAVIGKDVAGGFSTLASATFSYSAGTAYWLRFRLVSTNLYFKAWQDGATEPGTWTVTATDSSLASGGFGLGCDSSSGTNTQFDSLTVTDTLQSLATDARATFLVRAQVATNAQAAFDIRAALASVGRATFKVRVPLALQSQAAFKIRALLSAEGRATWQIRAVLAARGQARFFVRSLLVASGRATFKVRSLLASLSQATFKIQASLMTLSAQGRAVFLIRSQMKTPGRAAWKIRAALGTSGRARFWVRVPLAMQGRAVFSVRVSLAAAARTLGKIRARLVAAARATFKIDQVVTPSGPQGRAVTWKTRDGAVTWETRDGQVKWETRDGDVTWKTRS